MCEEVHFMEVEYPRPIHPRLVIQFSNGLSILIENEEAIPLAGKFIDFFRACEEREGGSR